ncbi:MAG: T9SS type A sorting domain-containing protein [Bacillota bacterium]
MTINRKIPGFIVLIIVIFSSFSLAQSIIAGRKDDLLFHKNPKAPFKGTALTRQEKSLKEEMREKEKMKEKEEMREKENIKDLDEYENEDEQEEKERFDEPGKFFEYDRMIRLGEGQSEPQYLPNYQVTELNKAINSARLSKSAVAAQSLNWIERGPGNVSGRTRGILIDPSDKSGKTWFVGSASGGVWKTTDMGYNWVNKTPELPNLATTVLSQSASNPDIIYCGTGEGFSNIDAVKGSGIFKSTDHGNSWSQLPSTVNFNFYCVNRIIVDPQNPDILLACTRSGPDASKYPGGILRSTDGGTSWTKVYTTSAVRGVQDLQADPSNFQIQYASVHSIGVIKSTNSGLSWSNTGTGLSTSGRIEIAVSGKNSQYLYAGAEISGGSALYMSTNAGQNWNKVNAASGSNPNWLGGQGWYDNVITVNPYNENIVYIAGIDIWQAEIVSTQNFTANFSPVTDAYGAAPKPYIHPDQHSLVIFPKDPANGIFWIVNGNDGGVYVSTDNGTSWRATLSGGYNTTQFYGVDKKHGANEYIGGTQDNGTWLSPLGADADGKTEYKSVIGGDGFEAAWHYKNPLKIIGSSQYNNFRKSTDGGESWFSATSGLSDVGSGKGQFISKIAKSNIDPDIIYTTGSKGIWRSENFGDSWNLSTISSGTWAFNSGATPISISLADPQIVWSGSSFSNLSSRLFLSTDAGLTFNLVSPYGGVSLGTITGINTHPADPKTAYLTFSISGSPKILRTTDLGNSWQDITGFGSAGVSSNGFPNVATYCVLQMPFNTNIIWAGTEIGLFESTDNGLSWHYAQNGLPAVCIWDMKIVDDQVILATHGRGIYSVTLTELKGYSLPVVTLSPLLLNLAQAPDGQLVVQADLRSAYDSVLYVIDSTCVLRQTNTTPVQPVLRFPVSAPAYVRASIIAYKNEKKYQTMTKDLQMVTVQPYRLSYYNDFNKISNDFSGNFSVKRPAGFSSSAIHSPHPYTTNVNYLYSLNFPLKVAAENAFVEYDDIAIVEPGDPGTKFGDEAFWDYVVVEASTNGFTWVPLENGYDCNYNDYWRKLWDNGSSPDSTAFIHHKINLLSKFNAGDVILLRLRLFSDEGSFGWGWAIDNFSIQGNLTEVNDPISLPEQYSLAQNYPNPFNPSTTITYALSKRSNVELKIFDMLGREVTTLVNREEAAGTYKVDFDASALPSGIYIYRIKAGDFTSSRKLMLLK